MVPDFFPVLKFLEHSQKRRRSRKFRGPSSSGPQSTSSTGSPRLIPGGGAQATPLEVGRQSQFLPVVPELTFETSSETLHSGSHDSRLGSRDESHDPKVGEGEGPGSGANRVVEMDKIEEEVQRLARRCRDRCRLLSCTASGSPRNTAGRVDPSGYGSVPTGDDLVERLNSFDVRRRVPSNEMV